MDWDGVIDREFIKHRAAKLLVAAARAEGEGKSKRDACYLTPSSSDLNLVCGSL